MEKTQKIGLMTYTFMEARLEQWHPLHSPDEDQHCGQQRNLTTGWLPPDTACSMGILSPDTACSTGKAMSRTAWSAEHQKASILLGATAHVWRTCIFKNMSVIWTSELYRRIGRFDVSWNLKLITQDKWPGQAVNQRFSIAGMRSYYLPTQIILELLIVKSAGLASSNSLAWHE